MGSRFRVSKFKNQTLKLPVSDLQQQQFALPNTLPTRSGSNWIAASGYLNAYLSGGDEISISPSSPAVVGHRPLTTIRHVDLSDFAWSPFHDDLLAVAAGKGTDSTLRLHRIDASPANCSDLSSSVSAKIEWQNRVEDANFFPLQNAQNNNNDDDDDDADSDRIAAIRFHPTVDALLACVGGKRFWIYDLRQTSATSSSSSSSALQSYDSGLTMRAFDFDYDGRCAAFAGPATAGFTIQLYDVRSNEAVAQTSWSAASPTASARIIFLSSADRAGCTLLTSSIDRARHRIVSTWDIRQLSTPLHTSIDFQQSSSNHIFLPLLDPAAGLIYFALQNGNSLAHFEIDQLIGGSGFEISAATYPISHSIKGATLASKRSLDVMQAEINRLLVLTSRLVYPCSYRVPRKSYYDFHADLYADIRSPDCSISVEQFFATTGDDDDDQIATPKLSQSFINLDPRSRDNNGRSNNLFRFNRKIGTNGDVSTETESNNTTATTTTKSSPASSFSSIGIDKSASSSSAATFSSTSSSNGNSKIVSQDSLESADNSECYWTASVTALTTGTTASSVCSSSTTSIPGVSCGKQTPSGMPPKPIPAGAEAAVRPNALAKKFVTAKCRYVKGSIGGRETHVTNCTNICRNISPLCEPFAANSRFGLFPIGQGIGGGSNQLAIVDLRRSGRLAGGVQSHLLCGDAVTAFALDPFRVDRAAVATQSGSISLFTLPMEDEITISDISADTPKIIDSPDRKLICHNGRVTSLVFNPLASDIIASAGTDCRVAIWNIATGEMLHSIDLPDAEQIFSIAWNRAEGGGTVVAILGRSKMLYLYDVRAREITQRGPLPCRANNGRVCWIADDRSVLVTSFNGLSERQIYLFDAANIAAGVVSEHGLDVSPQVLVPTFDDDTQTLFLTGKGDCTIYAFEIDLPADREPSDVIVTPLSHFETPTPHQAIAFLSKRDCDVRRLEIARGFRLTANSIEPFSFSIPRLHLEYFHEDLFPPTARTWEPLLCADRWIELTGIVSGESVNAANFPPIERVDLRPDGMQNFGEVRERLAAEKSEKIRANQAEKFLAEQREQGLLQSRDIGSMDDPSFMHNFAEMIRIGKEKQEKLVEQISGMVQFDASKNDLDAVEGVDPDEWND